MPRLRRTALIASQVALAELARSTTSTTRNVTPDDRGLDQRHQLAVQRQHAADRERRRAVAIATPHHARERHERAERAAQLPSPTMIAPTTIAPPVTAAATSSTWPLLGRDAGSRCSCRPSRARA